MGPDFVKQTRETIAKRAGYHCSNPDCGKLTVGPASEKDSSTSIGAAAHIFAAREGWARYRSEQTDAERSIISNAIWLCADCHALIDSDASAYPANLLLEWKTMHEAAITKRIGKPGELIRLRYQIAEAEEFNFLPRYARQIILDKPKLWEYILTVEALEFYLAPVQLLVSELKKKLYSKPLKALTLKEYLA